MLIENQPINNGVNIRNKTPSVHAENQKRNHPDDQSSNVRQDSRQKTRDQPYHNSEGNIIPALASSGQSTLNSLNKSSDHLMTGSDFVCHLIEVGLNLLVDSYFLFDHLMTGLRTSHQMIEMEIRIHKEIQTNHNQLTNKIRHSHQIIK
jgi:hypothetical protein